MHHFMKPNLPFTMRQRGRLLALLALLIPLAATGGLAAEVIPGKAISRAVQGLVSYSDEDGQGMPLKAETILHPGAVIQTESSGLAEIAFDGGAGILRLGGNTTLILQKLTVQRTREGELVEIQLTLKSGTIVGRTDKLQPGSNFEIKTSSGLAGVRQGLYRVDASGKTEVAEGLVLFVATYSGSAPAMNTLQTPPAKMFVPGEGVKTTPATLASELAERLAVKFKKR
jgi:hypothetical protein